jgi:hypothetical protein
MLNTMIVVKITKTNYTKWKKLFDGDAENRAKFMRDALVGKVDENTAVVTSDVFDPEGMKQALSDPELGKSFEEMGIEHTIYMLQPAPVPGS